MTASTRILGAIAAMTLSLVLLGGVLVAFDVYLHKHFEQMGGLNTRGYRGPLAKRKQPGEQRIVVVGESTVFGYGVPWQDAIPACLERKLNAVRRQQGKGPVSVINLAFNSEGAYGVNVTLRDYASLNYDVALLYTGVTDLGGNNTSVFRHSSPVFRLTGYLPIFPVVFREKAMALRYGGNLDAAYRGEPAVVRPNLAKRATAAALEEAVRIDHFLERQLERLLPDAATQATAAIRGSPDCPEPWSRYCQSMATAVDYVLSQGKGAVVVRSLDISDAHAEQQAVLTAMLHRRFPGLTLVNLGRVIDLHDRELCYDGRHLTAKGSDRLAELLVAPMIELLDARSQRSRLGTRLAR